jgi:serpin B
MTYAGARGDTERQIAQALHFDLDQARLHPVFAALEAGLPVGPLRGTAGQERAGVVLRIANSLWPQAGYPLLDTFLALVKAHYGASITPLDYGDSEAARRTINAWVEDRTEGKIVDLIQPGMLGAMTRLVLVNAIYFKGNWASQFDPDLTHDASFQVTPAQQVQVPMMTRQGSFRYAEHDGLQVIELPYAGDGLSMIILLPRQAVGLAGLEAELTVETLGRWTGGLRQQEVMVFLPRFRLESTFRLDSALMALGMADAFDMGKADFSGMDGQKGWLYIGSVIHKAFVDVNEEGTEAAAATAVIMRTLSVAPPLPIFRADRPFLFLIRDNGTGGILFLGRVVSPGERG